MTYPSANNNNHPVPTVSQESDIPEGWYTSRAIFDLERRALFSKTWLYLAHKSQFPKPGSYQSFNIAGFPIFLIKGRDDQIRAFHNVCRHRAYTITRKESGVSTVLGCRYHGWSYDTRGRLVKAPHFEDVVGFEKADNGLFEIHACTTKKGWVFVNLDAREKLISGEEVTMGLRGFERDAGVGLKSRWVAGKTLMGGFNWKLGTDVQYFENLSLQLAEQFSRLSSPSFAAKLVKLFTQRNNTHTSVFPNTLLYSFPTYKMWLSLNFLPATEASTQIRYDLFASSLKVGPDEDNLVNAVEAVFQSLITQLETEYHAISKGSQGLAYTDQILTCLRDHAKLERARGAQILPSMRQPKGSSLFQQAEQLCKEIDCSSSGLQSSGLDW